MPWSCFGKKDKKAGDAAEKYSSGDGGDGGVQEAVCAPAQAPAPTHAPAPAQTQPAPATPPTPVTPTAGDPRLRPEDDPDKASRRRDVVASFYSDQCELIGFKATGSRPPSAVAGGAHGEGPAATSSLRSSALSRADLAIKRREFFKDLAVNDLNSSRYGSSEPSWRLVDSGALTTPRRPHHHDGPHHHTLPLQARYGGLVLRPVTSPAKGTSDPDLRMTTNGHSGNTYEQWADHSHAPEEEPLLGGGGHQDHVVYHAEAGGEEPRLSRQQSDGDQPLPAVPVTPPVTPATTPPLLPPRAQPFTPSFPSHDQPPAPDSPLEEAATHSEGGSSSSSSRLAVHQQYVQQVSVPSDDERLGEGSCILIEEAFREEPRSHGETAGQDVPYTTTAPGPAPHQAAQHAQQHSREQPTTPPPSPRRGSLPEEDEEWEVVERHTGEAALDAYQDLTRPTSSPETSAPGSPLQPRQMTEVAAPPDHHQDPFHPQQGSEDREEEARLSPTIVACIPKGASTQDTDPPTPSPPNTPPAHRSPPSSPEEIRPPAPTTLPGKGDPAIPSPPGVTCGVEVSSPLEDDGLGSDIDDALSSLECLTEEGNSEKRATAST
ncbi:hypothetical protein GWK47_035852 [Chionoecetes opilio]|uniref:Uncharacterized protein n=1 Tax=Chionoecetes opilio TaxID=41210 RepID=A0A8J4YGE2_CHIOP|nr:hypothetical protein GWK47_035852 [Chionoecetes opilio]